MSLEGETRRFSIITIMMTYNSDKIRILCDVFVSVACIQIFQILKIQFRTFEEKIAFPLACGLFS